MRSCCVTIKLRGVEAVATVHMEQKLEHYDPRDTTSSSLHFFGLQYGEVLLFCIWVCPLFLLQMFLPGPSIVESKDGRELKLEQRRAHQEVKEESE